LKVREEASLAMLTKESARAKGRADWESFRNSVAVVPGFDAASAASCNV